MRQIERMMLAAVDSSTSLSMNNTAVVPATEDKEGQVLLHGNLIATFNMKGQSYLVRETLERWPTLTTMSRLRALGFDVYQKGGEVYIGQEAIR